MSERVRRDNVLVFAVRTYVAPDLEEAPERLRVFRQGPEGETCDVSPPEALEVREFAGGHGIAFPVRCFGTYVVALEFERASE